MRRSVLYERRCWLQWLILFFVVSLFSPLLVGLPTALGHSDTLGAHLCWNLMVSACRALRLSLLLSIRRRIVKFSPWL
jgi:hypothetical protein